MQVGIFKLISNNRYVSIRLLAVILCVLIVVLHKQLPDKKLTLWPSDNTYPSLFGPDFDAATQTGKGALYWVDKDAQKWRCYNPPNAPYSCGYSLALTPDLGRGLDLTGFNKFTIKLNHTGDAPHVRLALRNFNPKYDKGDRTLSAKFMSVLIQAKDLTHPVTVNMSEFTVAEWWMKEFDIPREWAAPEFDEILALSFDYISEGDNTLEIESIELSGAWMTSERLYLTILGFWLVVIIWESSNKFIELYRRYVHIQKQSEQLVKDYQELQKTAEKYETLSTTDVLTGVLNRAGIDDFLQKLFNSSYEKSHLGLILFDLDHFKRINDKRGHDAGDRVLVKFAKIVKSATRESDLFGRWGGEEFLLVCPLSSPAHIQELAEKLRSTVAKSLFEPDNPLRLTVSIGATLANHDEQFDSAFKRLDNALYESKNNGRNRVTFV